MLEPDHSPTWRSPRDIPGVVLHRPHLRRTLLTAVIVGTVLFAINQLDVVVGGDASIMTWVKVALTYLVPFVVSNLGIVFATQEQAS
ncbi:MAG: nitrate/nitrite transporter NrtS [Acidimicrobiales bacterium]|nr:nitrate/nitrite transporter NrtS [Acidimicrobiales bacterium]